MLESERSPTSCISSRNQATFKGSSLPHAPCQILVPAQSVCASSLFMFLCSLLLVPSLTLFSSPCGLGCSAPAPVSCPHLLSAAPPPWILARLCIPSSLGSARLCPGFPSSASPWLLPPCSAQLLALPVLLSLPPACSAPYLPHSKTLFPCLIRRLTVSSVLHLGSLDQPLNNQLMSIFQLFEL